MQITSRTHTGARSSFATSLRCASAKCKAITAKYRKAPIILREPKSAIGEPRRRESRRRRNAAAERFVLVNGARMPLRAEFAIFCVAVHETSNHVNVTSCNFAEVRVKNCKHIPKYRLLCRIRYTIKRYRGRGLQRVRRLQEDR